MFTGGWERRSREGSEREMVGGVKMVRCLWRAVKRWIHWGEAVVAVVVRSFPAKGMLVIGVTGTDGKTTVAHLIYEILRRAGKRVGLVSTIGAFVDGGEIDTGLHVTTPNAWLLQNLLRRMVSGGVEYVVLEVTSHGLEQYRVLGCNFMVGVLTNVTHEHLDYHGSFEEYRTAKARLFAGVRVAVLNKDDTVFRYFKERLGKGTRLVSYSLAGKATLTADRVRVEKRGMEFEVKEGRRVWRVRSQLIGDYNVSNILAACGVGRSLGADWGVILEAVEKFKGVRGRMEVVGGKWPFTVVIDFAHTPNALNECLRTLKHLTKGRLICVVGCAGERDRLKRPIMGKIAVEMSDMTVFTSEDPRHEDVDRIIESMVEGAKQAGGQEWEKWQLARGGQRRGGVFVREPDRRGAIGLAIKTAGKGDVVVICGKGHEKSMAWGDEERPWSDEAVAREILREQFRG